MIDKNGANLAGLLRINVGLKFSRTKQRIEILCVKYLNNIVEQDHRFIVSGVPLAPTLTENLPPGGAARSRNV